MSRLGRPYGLLWFVKVLNVRSVKGRGRDHRTIGKAYLLLTLYSNSAEAQFVTCIVLRSAVVDPRSLNLATELCSFASLRVFVLSVWPPTVTAQLHSDTVTSQLRVSSKNPAATHPTGHQGLMAS